jgi:hypothetical protein
MAAVCSTAMRLAAPLEVGEAEAPPMYRLRKSFAVVHFDPSGKGRIVFLLEGAELKVVGSSRLPGCCEVLSGNELYNIFETDLTGPWGMRLKSGRLKPAPARPVAACA